MFDQQKQAVEQTVQDARLQAAGCRLQGLAIRFKHTSEVFKGMDEKMRRTREEADRRGPDMQIHIWRQLQCEILEGEMQ